MKRCEWYIPITHDNCTCIFHDLSKLFSSAHEVYRFRRALPCFYLGKVTVTIIISKRGGMFKMLLWDFWQRMGHELINIHLGTDDSPCVVRPWSDKHSTVSPWWYCNKADHIVVKYTGPRGLAGHFTQPGWSSIQDCIWTIQRVPRPCSCILPARCGWQGAKCLR